MYFNEKGWAYFKKINIKSIPTFCLVLAIIAFVFIFWGFYQNSLGNMSEKFGEVVIVKNRITDASNDGKYVLATGRLTVEDKIDNRRGNGRVGRWTRFVSRG